MNYFDSIMKTTSSNLRPPALPGDVGFDLPANESVFVRSGQSAEVHTGIYVELPPGHFGLILPKSSANRYDLIVKVGVIDQGYRGELLALAHNPTDNLKTVFEGEAIAQLVVLPMVVPKLVRVDRLSDSERGEQGFGSTGNGMRTV